jgi:cytoskeletal protein RodZ
LQLSTNKETGPLDVFWEPEEMLAVPVAIVVLWVATLSAQVGVVWPNYETEQKKAEQAEKGASEEKSKKAKSEQGNKSEQGKKPASKNKSLDRH